jgi:hypothetical protein
MAFTCRQRPLQAQAGQAVPGGREGARIETVINKPWGLNILARIEHLPESVDEPATSTTICSLLNVRARLCHRLCTL